MSRVVLVHGIAQQVKGPETLLAEWYPALCDGLTLASYPTPDEPGGGAGTFRAAGETGTSKGPGPARGPCASAARTSGPGAGPGVAREDVAMAFYGDLFRPRGHRGVGEAELGASDVTDGLERELLLRWWTAAAGQDSRVAGPAAAARLRTPLLVQRALDALSHSAFFAGLGERAMIGSARQVRRYFTEPAIRAAARERLARAVTADTELIIAHSLGTVVAYETLCAHPQWRRPA